MREGRNVIRRYDFQRVTRLAVTQKCASFCQIADADLAAVIGGDRVLSNKHLLFVNHANHLIDIGF